MCKESSKDVVVVVDRTKICTVGHLVLSKAVTKLWFGCVRWISQGNAESLLGVDDDGDDEE